MKLTNKLGLLTVVSIFCFCTQVIAAPEIHFTEYRFVLNDTERSTSFRIFNKGGEETQCDLGLTHYIVAENGDFTKTDDLSLLHNPAKQLIRFSPRRVTIPPGGAQSSRISFRRIPNLADGEYISYMRLSCKENIKDLPKGVPNINSQINYNLPIIIRHGQVKTESKLEQVKLISNTGTPFVSVRHARFSDASLIGAYQVVGKDSGDIYGESKDVKIYAPSKYLDTKIMLSSLPKESLQLRFVENNKLGTLVQLTDVVKG